MSCMQWRDALLDAGVGEDVAPELLDHLAECAACRAEKEQIDAVLGRIDGELGAALSVMPSAGFVPRVREALDGPPASSLARLPGWLVPVALAAGLVAWAVAGWREKAPSVPVPAPVVVVERSPAPAAPAVEPVSPAARAQRREEPRTTLPARARTAAVRSTTGPDVAALEVLVPRDQQVTLRRLSDSARRREFDARPLLEVDERAPGPAAMADSRPTWFPRESEPASLVAPIEIAPLTVEPLPEEGL
jgi:hypothetical protein